MKADSKQNNKACYKSWTQTLTLGRFTALGRAGSCLRCFSTAPSFTAIPPTPGSMLGQCRVSFLPIPARCFDLSFPVQPAHCYLMSSLRLLLRPFQRTNLHFPPSISFGGWQLIEAGPFRRERRGAEAELWVPLGSLLFGASSGTHSWHSVRARLARSPIISC